MLFHCFRTCSPTVEVVEDEHRAAARRAHAGPQQTHSHQSIHLDQSTLCRQGMTAIPSCVGRMTSLIYIAVAHALTVTLGSVLDSSHREQRVVPIQSPSCAHRSWALLFAATVRQPMLPPGHPPPPDCTVRASGNF
jgi:hypothetical protein